MMAGIEQKSFSQADQVTEYGEQGKAEKVTLGMSGFGVGSESTAWLSTLKPGWSWQRNIQPNVPFERCPLHHREYVVAGRIRYEMTDATVVEASAGDHLLIEPGHQATVIGEEDCVLLDW
jgi:hypothetical protein